MKTFVVVVVASLAALAGCEKDAPPSSGQAAAAQESTGAATVVETSAPRVSRPDAPKNVVDVAVGSRDHTTLVAALKAADLVDSLTNPGPLTVFAPTNAAFDKLPKGTVESLLKPDKVEDLRNILEYHVTTSIYQLKDLHDGQVLGEANGGKVTFHVKDGKVKVNDANIVTSIPVSNGIIHVIDAVLLPPAKS